MGKTVLQDLNCYHKLLRHYCWYCFFVFCSAGYIIIKTGSIIVSSATFQAKYYPFISEDHSSLPSLFWVLLVIFVICLALPQFMVIFQTLPIMARIIFPSLLLDRKWFYFFWLLSKWPWKVHNLLPLSKILIRNSTFSFISHCVVSSFSLPLFVGYFF